MEKISKLLRNTRNVLEKFGHVKYKLSNGNRNVCLLGAMDQALTGDPNSYYEFDNEQKLEIWTAMKYINIIRNENEHLDNIYALDSAISWNNNVTTTLEEICKVISLAADIAESVELSGEL